MPHIALTVDPACKADPTMVAFWVVALDQQAREFASAWGVPYLPVVYYSADVLQGLADDELTKFTADARLLTIQTTMEPGALGFHDDVAGVIFARVLYQGEQTPVTASHEICELLGDPECNGWVEMSPGKSVAKESADPVEGDIYEQPATIGDETREVGLSNYVLLSYFDSKGAAPFDRMGKLTAPFGMTTGGYQIIMDASGDTTDVFASWGTSVGRMGLARKLERPDSRAARRLATKAR